MLDSRKSYAFGMEMPGRKWQASNYRYSHNGHEKEDEVFSGAQSAEYWMYDSRLGRRWETDPIIKEWESPYACFRNNPIKYADPKGLDGENRAKKHAEKTGGTAVKGNNGKWYVDEGYAKQNTEGGYDVGVSTKEFSDRWYEKAGKAIGKLINKATDVVHNGDFTAEVDGGVSLGIQAKLQGGLGKNLGGELSLNLATIDLLKSKLNLSRPNKGDWSYNSDWSYVGENGKAHISQEAKLGIDILQYPVIEGVYKNEFDLEGLNYIQGTNKSDYGVSLIVPLVKKSTSVESSKTTLKSAAEAMGYLKKPEINRPTVNKDKDFYGLDIGAGAALFIGIDLNIKIGFNR